VVKRAIRGIPVNPFMPMLDFFIEVDHVAEWADGEIGGGTNIAVTPGAREHSLQNMTNCLALFHG
jgi:hypothetical protein